METVTESHTGKGPALAAVLAEFSCCYHDVSLIAVGELSKRLDMLWLSGMWPVVVDQAAGDDENLKNQLITQVITYPAAGALWLPILSLPLLLCRSGWSSIKQPMFMLPVGHTASVCSCVSPPSEASVSHPPQAAWTSALLSLFMLAFSNSNLVPAAFGATAHWLQHALCFT
eukprot:3740200-Rhodomonas_salina.2